MVQGSSLCRAIRQKLSWRKNQKFSLLFFLEMGCAPSLPPAPAHRTPLATAQRLRAALGAAAAAAAASLVAVVGASGVVLAATDESARMQRLVAAAPALKRAVAASRAAAGSDSGSAPLVRIACASGRICVVEGSGATILLASPGHDGPAVAAGELEGVNALAQELEAALTSA